MTRIDPDKYYQAAAKMLAASRTLEQDLRNLDAKLDVSNTAGTYTSGGPDWAQAYDQAASDLFEIGSLTAMAYRELGYQVHEAGANHQRNQDGSAPGRPEPTIPNPPAGASLESSLHPTDMSSGGLNDLPTHWDLIADRVTQKWPDCDTPRIAAAGKTFAEYGPRVDQDSTDLLVAMRPIWADQEGPDVEGILTEFANVSTVHSAAGKFCEFVALPAGWYAEIAKGIRDGQQQGLNQLFVDISALMVVATNPRVHPVLRAAARSGIENSKTVFAAGFDEIIGLLNAMVALLTGVMDLSKGVSNNTNILSGILERTPRQTDPIRNRDSEQNKRHAEEAERRAGVPPGPKRTVYVNGQPRVPDYIDDANDQVTEVKNKNTLDKADTEQIKDELTWAEQNGYTMIVVTDHRTKLTPEVQALADEGKITVVQKELDDANDL